MRNTDKLIVFYAFGNTTSVTFTSACKLSAASEKPGMPDVAVVQIIDNSEPFIEADAYVLLYPVTYRSMCGTAKLWLEKNGRMLRKKEVMGVGFGGTQRSAHAFEIDFVSMMSGVGAEWHRRNTMIADENENDFSRAMQEIIEFGRHLKDHSEDNND